MTGSEYHSTVIDLCDQSCVTGSEYHRTVIVSVISHV